MQGGESAQAWTTQGGNESEGSSQERSDRFDAVAAAAAAAAIVCVARDDGLRAPLQRRRIFSDCPNDTTSGQILPLDGVPTLQLLGSWAAAARGGREEMN